jgi:hypothetical protein
MTTATYNQPSHRQPIRWFLPLAGLAFGVAGLAMSVVAIATDDVAEISDRAVVIDGPAATDSPSVGATVPVATVSLTDNPERCGFPRVGTIDRC